jgi:hypothetical protein
MKIELYDVASFAQLKWRMRLDFCFLTKRRELRAIQETSSSTISVRQGTRITVPFEDTV